MESNPQKVKIAAYYAQRLPSFEMTAHIHDRYEYMYAVDRECEVTVAGDAVTLRPREFIFLSPGVPHSLLVRPERPCLLLNLEFCCTAQGSGPDLAELAARDSDFARFWAEGRPYRLLSDTERVCFALKDLIGELERGGESGCMLSILTARLLIETARCRTHTGKTGVVYVNRAKAYIAENFDQDLTVGQVAAQAGVNPSYLQLLFSRHLGCGIMTYVNNLRLDRACFLLKNSGRSVTDIAFEAGFNSRQQFGYRFEKRFGQSPREYRRLSARSLEVDTKTFRTR